MNRKEHKFRKIFVLFLTVACVICSLGACGGASGWRSREVTLIDDNYRTWYEIFVYSFCDSDGDQIGDLQGVISKLDYIADMGFNGIWLMPIMPSASYHKYDVKDYLEIEAEYGTMADFEALVAECDKRGIKLIIDLVLNHTSSEHPWFVEACDYLASLGDGEEPSAADCPYYEYYHFTKGDPSSDTWYQVGSTDYYYEGVFWSGMPDLNFESQTLRAELEEVMDFWLEKGVGGFRLDAVKEFYREETRTVVKIHPGALEKIREEAYATQEKLIVPEDMTGDGMPVNICREIPGTEEHREETGKAGAGQGLAQEETSSSVFFQESQPQAGDIWQELWAALTETERKALQLIQQGGTDLKTFSDERDIMLEVLIDGINEKAVDFVGDSLLDQEAAVYDDYIVQVKGMVEEI